MTEADRLSVHANVPLALAQLVAMHADRLGYTLRNIRNDRRQRPLVRARWQIIALARNEGFSLPVIGRAMNRDHTSIIHALRTVAA